MIKKRLVLIGKFRLTPTIFLFLPKLTSNICQKILWRPRPSIKWIRASQKFLTPVFSNFLAKNAIFRPFKIVKNYHISYHASGHDFCIYCGTNRGAHPKKFPRARGTHTHARELVKVCGNQKKWKNTQKRPKIPIWRSPGSMCLMCAHTHNFLCTSYGTILWYFIIFSGSITTCATSEAAFFANHHFVCVFWKIRFLQKTQTKWWLSKKAALEVAHVVMDP